MHQASELWITNVEFCVDIWCPRAHEMFCSCLNEAWLKHDAWLEMSPAEQAVVERTLANTHSKINQPRATRPRHGCCLQEV
eukprot:6407597-Amphidinium_carterae.1